MQTILYTLLVISGLMLIVMILLQSGKGAGAGLSIGGGMSQTMFGGSGGRTFFVKFTAGLATFFMVLCLILARMASHATTEYKGIMAGAQAAPQAAPQPVQPVAPVSPQAAAPAPQPFKADVPAPAAK